MIKGSVMEKLIELAPYQDACLVILRNTRCRNGGLILKKKNHTFWKIFPIHIYFFCSHHILGPCIRWRRGWVTGWKIRICTCIGTILRILAIMVQWFLRFFFQDKPSIFKIICYLFSDWILPFIKATYIPLF